MTRYKKFDSYLWNDVRFSRLSNQAKLLFLYVISHPGMTSVGVMKCTLTGLREELKIDDELQFKNALFELLQLAYIKYDRETGLLFVPSFTEVNTPETPAVIRSWAKLFECLPACGLLIEAFDNAAHIIKANKRRGYQKVFNESIVPMIAKTRLAIEQLPQTSPSQSQLNGSLNGL